MGGHVIPAAGDPSGRGAASAATRGAAAPPLPDPRPAAFPEPRPAASPPEARGIARDEVALLVSDGAGHHAAAFLDLASFLRSGDLLVVNDSATLPARLPLRTAAGEGVLHLATRYAPGLWLAEPRWSPELQGPLPLAAGDGVEVAGLAARLVAPYPGLPRLWFVRVDGDAAMDRAGAPIRYAHIAHDQPLRRYQTVFARVPGSAEMPSAGRPFSPRALRRLRAAGIRAATITLHTSVSSLEHDGGPLAHDALPPEPFRVPRATADAVNRARAQGRRIVAIGTSVVRALESAVDRGRVHASGGFTRRVLHPGRRPDVVDGLLTGFHEPRSTHLALLTALAGEETVRDAYDAAARGPYLWHEFGDVHLLLPPRTGGGAAPR
jgi:S-adenosylmethionine:tRNA ribosyltransferase-isomerase